MNQDHPENLESTLHTVIPHTNMRKTVARRLSESKKTIPHFYVTVQCNVAKLVKLRQQRAEAGRTKISINDYVIYATASALKAVPAMNAWWGEDAITRHAQVNICIAIGTDRGLFTPVLRSVDEMSVEQVSIESVALIKKSTTTGFKMQDYEGGTFTVTNLGMYGVKEFSAIINPPQVGILAIGGIETIPGWYMDASEAPKMMHLTVSADHRAVDGVVVAKFLTLVKSALENPSDVY